MLFGAGIFRFRGWGRRVSGTRGKRCILDTAAYGVGLLLFILEEAIDLFKEGNDVGRSHWMPLLLFSLFLSVGMLLLRAEEEKSLAVPGRSRYPLS